MKAWPPKPGFTDINRIMSTLSMTYLRMSRGVAGLKTRPDLQPVERMSWSVRSTCVDGVLVAMLSAPHAIDARLNNGRRILHEATPPGGT